MPLLQYFVLQSQVLSGRAGPGGASGGARDSGLGAGLRSSSRGAPAARPCQSPVTPPPRSPHWLRHGRPAPPYLFLLTAPSTAPSSPPLLHSRLRALLLATSGVGHGS